MTPEQQAWSKRYEFAQSRIAELEREIENHRKKFSQLVADHVELELNYGTLMGLLKSAWISWQTSGDFGISRENAEAIFPEYCKEHNIENLKPNKRLWIN